MTENSDEERVKLHLAMGLEYSAELNASLLHSGRVIVVKDSETMYANIVVAESDSSRGGSD